MTDQAPTASSQGPVRSMRKMLLMTTVAATISVATVPVLIYATYTMVTRTATNTGQAYAQAVKTDCPVLATMVDALRPDGELSLADVNAINRQVKAIQTTAQGRAYCKIKPLHPLEGTDAAGILLSN